MQTHIITVPLSVVSSVTEKYKEDYAFQISAIDVYYGPVVFDLFLGLMTIKTDELHSMQGLNLFYLQITYADNDTGILSLTTEEYTDMLVRKSAPDIIVAVHTMVAMATTYAINNAPGHHSEDIAEQVTPGARHRIDQHWKS